MLLYLASFQYFHEIFQFEMLATNSKFKKMLYRSSEIHYKPTGCQIVAPGCSGVCEKSRCVNGNVQEKVWEVTPPDL